DNFDYQIYFIDNKFYTIDHMDKVTEIPKVKRVEFFDGYEKKGSSRVYIWSRSIPKIFEKPVFGHGQDTFPLVFPQNDFFGKKLSFGMKSILVDKPHNYFIQVALNNGIPALLVVGFLFLFYFYDSLKSFAVKKDVFNVCIFLSVFSYFVTCFFNDSVVSVAPLFWTLLAVGICLNSEGKEIL
uniref:O-antigen ligase family protein n=1 Tax=Ilyobacter sp. TaxID=3100343 RepID=UPI00356ABE07